MLIFKQNNITMWFDFISRRNSKFGKNITNVNNLNNVKLENGNKSINIREQREYLLGICLVKIIKLAS